MGGRSEPPTKHKHILLVKFIRRLLDIPIRTKHRRLRESVFYQLKRHKPIVDMFEVRAGNPEHIDFDAAHGESVQQSHENLFRIAKEQTRINHVYPHDTKGKLLLKRVR